MWSLLSATTLTSAEMRPFAGCASLGSKGLCC